MDRICTAHPDNRECGTPASWLVVDDEKNVVTAFACPVAQRYHRRVYSVLCNVCREAKLPGIGAEWKGPTCDGCLADAASGKKREATITSGTSVRWAGSTVGRDVRVIGGAVAPKSSLQPVSLVPPSDADARLHDALRTLIDLHERLAGEQRVLCGRAISRLVGE